MPNFISCFLVYTRLRVILVARPRYVSFLLYVRVFLGVIYTSVPPNANTANVWSSTALLILEVYHGVQSTEYAAVLTYH